MKAKDALKTLGVTRQTLYNYAKDGTIKTSKNDKGRIDYNDEDVYRMSIKTIKKRKLPKDLIAMVRTLSDACVKILENDND
jgi:predicted site-specific integrase-resolvase